MLSCWRKPLRNFVLALAKPRTDHESLFEVETKPGTYSNTSSVLRANVSSMNCWLRTVTFIGMSVMAVFMRVTSAALVDW